MRKAGIQEKVEILWIASLHSRKMDSCERNCAMTGVHQHIFFHLHFLTKLNLKRDDEML